MTGDTLTDFFGDVIHAYTRADAIRDGVLVELPAAICQEAGVIVPVAVTAEVWHLIDPGNLDQMPGQSVTGRLWDLLWAFTVAARSSVVVTIQLSPIAASSLCAARRWAGARSLRTRP